MIEILLKKQYSFPEKQHRGKERVEKTRVLTKDYAYTLCCIGYDVKALHTPHVRHSLLTILHVVAFTIILFSSPCQAGQTDMTPGPSGEKISSDTVTAPMEKDSAIEQRMAKEKEVYQSTFAITPHRPNYILLFTYDSNPNVETYEFAAQDAPENYEVKFQLSFKILLWNKMYKGKGDLFVAYTQRSFWQLYDKALSSPFRDTNYEPELFIKFDTDFNVLGLRNRLFLIGFNHQSNGRGEPLSRSWNRVYAEFVAERGNFVLALKPWYRIPEDEEDDDNPHIEKYMGYGELIAAYRFKKHIFSIMFRNNLRGDGNKGAVELGWSFPITHKVRGYVQYFNGYGESLLDYNESGNRIGFGVMLNDWI